MPDLTYARAWWVLATSHLFFAIDRVKALAPQHPEWNIREPFASLLRGDVKGSLPTARHPRTGRLFTSMVYQPMLELLNYPRTNGWTVVDMKDDWKVIYPPANK
ncbi:MAG: hypothetical protein R3E50_06535 [Halioglobus sp.]